MRLAIILAALLIGMPLLPQDMVAAADDGAGEFEAQETADYGIYKKMDDLTKEQDSHINSPQILQETKSEMDSMVESEVKPGNRIPPSYALLDSKMSDPRVNYPNIFSDVSANPMINHTTVLDWILPQPMTDEGMLNYWAVTKERKGNSTITQWGQGSLRPTLLYPHFSLDKWLYLNSDDNTGTGTFQTGYDVRARVSFTWENLQITRPHILPEPNTGNISIRGGLRLEIERLRESPMPIDVSIIKGFSYDENNYVFTLTATYEALPERTVLFLGVEKIEIGNVNLLEFLANMTNGLGDASLTEISGPYTILYQINADIASFKASIGIMKLMNRTLEDKTWLRLGLATAQGEDHIPRDGQLWLNSENIYAPIDIVIWKAGEASEEGNKIPTALSVEYCEERVNITYARALITDLPSFLNVTLDYTQQHNGKNLTVLDLTAADHIDRLFFETYEFFKTPLGFNMDVYNTTHVVIEHLPKRLHVAVTSDIGHTFDFAIYNNPTYSLMGNIIDNVVGRIAGRLYRLGMVLRSLPENMMALPSSQGWLKVDTYNDYISDVYYWHSSGAYLDNLDRNFVAFLKDHTIDQREDPRLSTYAISGHLKNIKLAEIDFKDRTNLYLEQFGHEPLDVIALDGTDYVYAEISNLPDHLNIEIVEGNVYYRTDPKDYSSAENRIGAISLYSSVGKNFLNLNVLNMPGNFTFSKEGSRIKIDAGNEFIDMVEFSIINDTTFPVKQIKDGNFVYVSQTKQCTFASARLFGLSGVDYQMGDAGFIDIRMKEESVMRFKIFDELTSRIDIQLILTPFPAHFSMDLPQIINASELRIPDLVNITGLVDYGTLMFSVARLSTDVLGIITNVTTSLVSRIGGIGTDFTFSYNLNSYTSSMDMIGVLKKGEYESLGGVDWTHGMCMKQRARGDELDFWANFYMQGLPSAANMSIRLSQDQMNVSLDLKNYNPKYPWLIIKAEGVQQQDISLFLSGIPPNVDLKADIGIYTDLNIGGRMSGNVFLQSKDQHGNLVNMDELYVFIRKYGAITSIREAYLPNIPGRLKIDFSVEMDISMDYEASIPIEYMFVKISKNLLGTWSSMVITMHDVPMQMKVNMTANMRFSMLEPMPLQNFPNFEIDTFGSNTLDLYFTMDGSGMGQRGRYQIYLRDIGDNTRGRLIDSTTYSITSDGLGYMDLSVFGLTFLDQLRVDAIHIRGTQLRSFTISIYMFFGIYPTFDITDLDGLAMQIELHTTFIVGGREFHAKVAIIDVAFRDMGAGGGIPAEFPLAKDRLSIDMRRHTRHIIIPTPLGTGSSLFG